MKKWYIVFLFLVVFSLFLCSCGSSSGVPDKKIMEDLALREEVQNCYKSQYTPSTPYHIAIMEIIKEQLNEEDKQDLIFCDITVENEHFSVSFEAEIEYNYYDRGGWIMDEIIMENVQITPIAVPDKGAVSAELNKLLEGEPIYADYSSTPYTLEHGHITLGKFDNIDKTQNSVKILSQFTSPVLIANGYYSIYFWENEWHFTENPANGEVEDDPIFYITDYTCDYSNACGTFSTVSELGGSNTLTVHQISDREIVLTINSFEAILREDDNIYSFLIPVGEKVSRAFDPFIGGCTDTLIGDRPFYWQYDPFKDVWTNGLITLTFERVK